MRQKPISYLINLKKYHLHFQGQQVTSLFKPVCKYVYFSHVSKYELAWTSQLVSFTFPLPSPYPRIEWQIWKVTSGDDHHLGCVSKREHQGFVQVRTHKGNQH
jgi:hypothetical protein